MGLFERFPYTNFHDLNLDWILEKIRQNEKKIQDFIGINTIKYADPILWDITSQYEANTVVIDPQNGSAYISTQAVPYGVTLSNTTYWTQIYNYASELARLREQIAAADEGTSTTASGPRAIGALAWVGGVLLRVTSPMIAGDSYVVGSNCVDTTIELEIDRARAFAQSLSGDLLDLGTVDKTNLVAAINEVLADLVATAGDLSSLNTVVKTDLVSAINEVLADLVSTAGDLTYLNTTIKTDLVSAINEVLADLGDLSSLGTVDQSSGVAAINELLGMINALQGEISTIATATAERYGASGSVSVYSGSIGAGDSSVTIAGHDYKVGNDFIIPGAGDPCAQSAPLAMTAVAAAPGATHVYSIAAVDRFGGHSVYTSASVSATIDPATPVTLSWTPAGTPYAYALIRDGAVVDFIDGGDSQYIDGGATTINNLPIGFDNVNALTRGFARFRVTAISGDVISFAPACPVAYTGAIYHDDTRALQAALDAGNLTFGGDHYNLANSDRLTGYATILTVPSDRIIDGDTATLHLTSTYIAGPALMNQENVYGSGPDHDITIRDLKIDGGLESPIYTERNAKTFNIGGAIYIAANGLQNPYGIRIEGCTIVNALCGISMANVHRFAIESTRIENTSRDGILIADGCVDGTINGCSTMQTGDDGIGISGAGQYNITVTSCVIRNAGSRCINAQGNFVTIIGCTCAGSAWSAIEPNCNYPGSVCQNVTITGCVIYDAGNYTGGINGWDSGTVDYDIKIYDRGDGSPASNITINGCIFGDSKPFAIIGNNPTPVNTVVFKDNILPYGAEYDFQGLYDIIFTDTYDYHGEESVTIATPGAAVTQAVTFRTPLPAIPVVMLSPSWGTNTSYINAYATNITKTGFDLIVNAGVADTFKVVWTATV